MSQRYIGGLIYNPPGGFSGYFDGSGDFLTWTGTAAGSGAFCYEFWIFSQNGFATMRAPLGVIATSGYNSALDIRMTGSTINVSQYNVATNNFTVDPLQANTWYHIAVCRNASNQTTVFVNGVRSSTGAVTLATNFSGLTSAIGRLDPSNGGDVTGYISNVRLITGSTPYDPTQTTITVPSGPLQAISGTQFLSCAYPTFRDGSSNNFTITVNGNTAVSTQNPFPQTQLPNPALGNQGNGVYTMSQYQALRSQNLWPAIDPYFDYVTLMLHGNGTNGAQNNTFLDSSTNNFTITRNGNTTQGTFTPYGANWSNYFVDSSSSYLNIASSSIVNFGTSDFTAEAWVNLNALDTSIDTIISNYNNGSNGGLGWYINRGTNGGIQVYSGNSLVVSASSAVTAGTWNHIAICRASGTTRIFVNGAIAASASDSSNYGADNSATGIGGTPPGSGAGAYLPGYLSNVRVVKGTALYTSAFTPSTSPLTAISGTSLLTCQSNRFIDNSTNNFTITRNGDVSVQRFSPFNPTTPYAAGTIGGSGYFDGSGDYLNGPTTGQFAPTGDFTISMWFYPTSFAASYYVLAGSWNAGASDEWLIQYDNTGAIRFLTTTDSTFSAAGVVKLNQWQFLSISRSGSTVTGYINGTSFRSYTLTGTVGSATKTVYVGIQAGTTWPYVGYISDYRLVAGSAQSATPPTSPATAISGTNTLLNFTNGGIIDNAMMNDLETVGNAQISTSVSRFGGGSLAFDGTSAAKVVAPSSPIYDFGTGDFTVELWAYFNSVSSIQFLVLNGTGIDVSPSATCGWALDLVSGNLRWERYDGTQTTYSFAWTPATSTWYHIAVTRSGTSLRAFINGTQIGTTQTSALSFNRINTTAPLTIGNGQAGGGTNYPLNGYIDDFRITKGYARYTANFTPQRSQWQDQ